MKVKELYDLNENNISSNTKLVFYKYLDTGSITRNIIDDIKIYNNKEKLPSRAKRLVKKGDIIISTVRPNQEHYGYIDNLSEELIVSTGFAVLSPKEKYVNGKYLYYFLTRKKIINYLQMIAEGSVSAYPSIKPDVIGNIDIELPKRDVQDKIVKKINVFEDKISQNLKAISKLQQYSQLLYYKWFVEFNFIDNDGREYKKNNGKFKRVNGKEIPLEWEYISLNKIVEKMNENITPKNQPKKLFKYYSIPVFDDTRTYKEELGESILSNKFIVNENNLLVSKLNPWFKRIVYPMWIKDAICSTEFVVWKPKEENLLEYLYILANSERFITYCTNASSGTSNSHKRVKPEFMMRYRIPYNEEVVSRFNEIAKPIVKKINLLLLENNKLKEMKDILINKLIK